MTGSPLRRCNDYLVYEVIPSTESGASPESIDFTTENNTERTTSTALTMFFEDIEIHLHFLSVS